MPTAKNTPDDGNTPLDHPINKKITHELTNITPVIAEKWLGQNHGNRNLRSRKVANYARDMRNGAWMTSGDSIKFDWNGRMIDGQHRLEAVIESGATIRVLVVRGLEPSVQGVLDVNVKRSASDALKFNGHTHQTIVVAAMARIANARAQGFLRTATSSTIPEMTNAEVVAWYEAHPESVNAAALALKVAKSIGGTPSALAYCAWVLEAIDPEAAVEFFLSTAEFRTEGKSDPRATLLNAFRRLQENRTALTAALQISLVFRAWNAWRGNKKVSTLPTTTNGKSGVQIPEPK